MSGKGGKQRSCVITRPAFEALGAYLPRMSSGYVFVGRHMGHLCTRQILRLLDEIARGCRPPRDEARQGMAEEEDYAAPPGALLQTLDIGIDIAYLQQQLGYSSLSATAIYLKARPNHRRRAYESAGFDEMLKPK